MKFCLYNITTAIKIGGIETFYWEVAQELRKRGHDVELISGVGKEIKYPELQLQQFHYVPREHILNLGNRFRKWGERVSFFLNAWSYLKRQKYDVFLIHKPLDFFTAFFMKKRNKNIKIVFMSGGEDFYGFDKFFSRYVDYMFAVSQDNAKKIENRYSRTIPVIPNGVDVEKFRPLPKNRKSIREELHLGSSTTLISVGRIVGLKGYQLVIEALQDLPEYQYILIGEGEYLSTLKKLANDIGVAERIHFLGSIKNDELPKYLNAGDIFVQPTIGNEAFGITIIEAMACGLPVVASKNGGITDIIQENVNGYMFEVGNVKKLQKILSEKTKLLLQFTPREYVKQNFTWEETVSKLLSKIELKKEKMY